MDRLLKLLIGVALLPFCVGATRTLWFLLRSIQPPSYTAVPLSTWGLAGGFLLWLLLFFCLPRPVRSYVLAHELTHALWGWLMGARVSKLRVSGKSGSVTLSKSNFIIALAPYFFPFYTVLVIAAYVVLSLFLDLRAYEPLWLGFVGLTWGFHLTFTVTTLMTHQPDIHQNGRIFSYAIIYFLNILGIGFWVVAVASPTLDFFADRLTTDTMIIWRSCAAAAAGTWQFVRAHAEPLVQGFRTSRR